jgi:hypothetical protein
LVVEYLLEFIPETDPSLLAVTHKIGGGLVTLGVVGELVIEFMHGRRETRLREVNTLIIEEATSRAEQAEKRVTELRSPRNLTEAARRELSEVLAPYAGVRVDIFIAAFRRDECLIHVCRAGKPTLLDS